MGNCWFKYSPFKVLNNDKTINHVNFVYKDLKMLDRNTKCQGRPSVWSILLHVLRVLSVIQRFGTWNLDNKRLVKRCSLLILCSFVF